MCVTSLLCGPRVDLWPFYVSFMGFLFFLILFGPHRRDVTHILSKVNCFFFFLYIEIVYAFSLVTEKIGFFSHTNSYILNVTQRC